MLPRWGWLLLHIVLLRPLLLQLPSPLAQHNRMLQRVILATKNQNRKFQRQFFSPIVDEISEPMTLLKYDLEISGFGSAALGHVCLLNLKNQTYPGSEGTKEKGWPTWTTPVMRWTKEQGGYAGYAHSGSGLRINVEATADRMLKLNDRNQDQVLSSGVGF